MTPPRPGVRADPDADGPVRRPVARAIRALATVSPPVDPDPSGELVRALSYVDAGVDARAVVRGGYGAALVGGLAAALIASLLAASPAAIPLAGAAAALSFAHVVHRGPVVLAHARRTRALGAATGLVGRAVLRARIEPAPERAARFAARTGDGPLARSLGAHVRAAAGTPDSGLGRFADEWAPWFPSVERATALLAASADAPADERGRTLDRALDAVVEGTHDRMAAFASTVRAPATAVYAFGVLLPLALVGVLPAARAAGVRVTLPAFVLVYDLLLPLALLGAGGWLLLRRPVAFPPPEIGSDHPATAGRGRRAAAAGVAAAVGGWALAPPLLAPWTAPVAAAGFGSGCALVVRYRPVAAVRRRVRAVEEGLPDALAILGRRVAEGESAEAALARTAEAAPGETGAVFADAARVQRTLRVGVREAFLGERGALSDLPSRRTSGAAALLALAASEGRPAGRVVVELADQLAALRRIEREARRELASVTDTLANTAAAFGPLVAGATVALADRMGGNAVAGTGVRASAASGASAPTVGAAGPATDALATADLGLAVGAYVLWLAATLTALSVGLARGFDRALVGYRVGLALLSATAVYLGTAATAGAVL